MSFPVDLALSDSFIRSQPTKACLRPTGKLQSPSVSVGFVAWCQGTVTSFCTMSMEEMLGDNVERRSHDCSESDQVCAGWTGEVLGRCLASADHWPSPRCWQGHFGSVGQELLPSWKGLHQSPGCFETVPT